ncbi:MAG: hypothetical protein NT009_09715 [Proteobacteria bacterium]|nr:hypothetical protein [Pseudomonadota bacterium]
MTEREIKERIIWFLELEGEELYASNEQLPELIGEPDQDKIESVLINLESEGLIELGIGNEWGEGRTKQIDEWEKHSA